MPSDLPSTNLVLDIPFTEGSGNTCADQSGNGHNLTLTDTGTARGFQ